MDDNDFERLVESIKQAGKIEQGRREPSRVFEVSQTDSDKKNYV